MILFSSITMRDLIRNYKMIIKGKTQESDTESEPLMSSSSTSSTQSFGTIGAPRIFKQESYSMESEEETVAKSEKKQNALISPFSIQGQAKRQLLYTSSYSSPEIGVFTNSENIYDFETYPKIKSDSITIITDKDLMINAYDDRTQVEQPATHHSLVTIFAIWNTTMGSSLLAMSWGLEKTGLFPGILINIAIAALCLYTAYVLLSVNEKHGTLGQNIEVPELCRMLIGRWAEILAKIFSIIVLIGANIVYLILMSNFLYNSVIFLYDMLYYDNQIEEPAVICPMERMLNINDTNRITQSVNSNHPTFDKIWDLYSTVPILLTLIMFPFLNFKSPTFFTKFNSLGTISVGYLLLFVTVKSLNWGVNVQSWTSEFYLKPTFCALSGMLSLSYFIHNIIISIMRNNKHQEHNGRDLSIAFGLITFTYIFIGVVFYISFPLVKTCIEDNILNNFSKRDTMTIIARILFLFQLFTVFPLIAFMTRNDIMTNLNMIKNYRFGDFSYGKVIFINIIILSICVLFACFLPRIGTLIRYTGALSGMVYIFMLPSLLKIASLRKEKALTLTKFIFHIFVVILGVSNLLSQFFINDNK